MSAPSRGGMLRVLACLAGGALGLLAWRQAGTPVSLAAAGLAGALALAAAWARRLPVGRSKYEAVSLLERAALGVALAGLAFFVLAGLDGLAQTAGEALRLARHPFASNVLDGREPSKAWLLLHGQTIYPPLDDSRLLVTLYNPLYHLVLAGLYGLSQELFAVARALNLLLAGGLLALVWGLGARGGSRIAAALAALAFALSEPFSFARFTRPDMLAWVLAFGGLALVHAALGRDARSRAGGRLALAAGLLLALAYLTKQQSLPFALGTALFLAGSRRWGLLLRAGGVFCAAVGAGLLAEGLLTGWDVFAHTVAYPRLIAANPEITSPGRGARRVLEFLAANWSLCAAWLAFLPERAAARRLELEEVVFAVNVPFLTVLLGTWGADANYPLSALALLCVLAARGLARAWARGPAWKAGCAALLLLALPGPVQLPPAGEAGGDALADALEQRAALVREVLAAPGPVLADVEGAPAFLGSVPPGKVTLYDAVELGAYVWARGRTLAGSALLEDIARRRFALIVNSPTLHAREYTKALHRHYRHEATLGPFELYRPRPALAILEITGLSPAGGPGGAVGDGFSARLEPGANLARVEGRDCWCVEDKRAGAEARLVLEAPRRDVAFEAGLYLMKSGPSGEVEAAFSANGRDLAPLAGLPGLGEKSFDAVWNEPLLLRGAWPGGPGVLALRLSGTATLCVSPVNPSWVVFGEPPGNP